MSTLFQTAAENNINVEYHNLPLNKSVSCSNSNGYFIGMDYSLAFSGAEENVHLAHELGHCITGSFYNVYSPLDIRGKHERRADEWAIKNLIPEATLNQAVKNGYVEPWDLAEIFNVTEEFIKKAICFYKKEVL